VKCDWIDFYKNIYDVLRNGKSAAVTHDQQRRLMCLVEAIFLSARKNQAVSLKK
jgi:hypothetical protein